MKFYLKATLFAGAACGVLFSHLLGEQPQRNRQGNQKGQTFASQEAFFDKLKVLDSDDDGVIVLSEVKDKRLKPLIERADADGDGKATRAELESLYSKEFANLKNSGLGGPPVSFGGGPGGPPPNGFEGRPGIPPPDGFGGLGGPPPGGFGGPPNGFRPGLGVPPPNGFGPGGPAHSGFEGRGEFEGGGDPRSRAGTSMGRAKSMSNDIGQVLSLEVRGMLNLTPSQLKDLDKLQADVDKRLAKILSENQKIQVEKLNSDSPLQGIELKPR